MKKIFKITLSLLFIAASFTSCVDDKDFDTPQVSCDDSFIKDIKSTQIKTFKYVLDKWKEKNPTSWNNQNIAPFVDNEADAIYLTGYVTSNDFGGNFYKELYIQDKIENPDYGLKLTIDNKGLYTKYPKGSKIYIKLNGLAIVKSHGELLIGEFINGDVERIRSKIADKSIMRSCTIETIIPKQIKSLTAINDDLIGEYVQLTNAQFPLSLKGKTYIDPDDSYSTLREIVFCEDESKIKLETSSFAKYAEANLPESKFNLSGILSRDYANSSYVLLIDSEDSFEFLDTDRCDPPAIVSVFSEDFNDFSDWTKYSVTGSQQWQTDATHGNPEYCAKMSGYSSGSNENEDWLITPVISLAANTADKPGVLAFQTAKNYDGPELEVFVSSDYTPGENPNTSGTWTPVSVELSSGNYVWANSGLVDISDFDGGDIYVAFKYTSTSSQSSTYEIDNLEVGYLE